MELKIKVEEEYELEKAICNHGFFMTAPNQWISSTKTFRRPLRLEDGCSSIMVSISSKILNNHQYLIIHVDDVDSSLSQSDQNLILKQVERMLRLTKKDEEDVRKFKKVHAEATSNGFGRLFRSPHLFEDIVKTILLCNTTFNRTLQMCESLCNLQADLIGSKRGKPRKKYKNSKYEGNFPSSKEISELSEWELKERGKLGFRAKIVLKLAKLMENGKLKYLVFDEEKVDSCDENWYDNIEGKLKKIKGIGPFASANILMCLGDYRNIPSDTETIQHLRQVHHISECTAGTVQTDAKKLYHKFAPYQSLAYWYELIESYERRLGTKLSMVPPSSYHKVAGGYLSNNKLQTEEQLNRKRTLSQASI